MTETPYSTLNPNLILNAIEELGLQCSGSLLALNSFENRVYQVGLEEKPPVVVKFYRPGRWSNGAIHEEHQFALELATHEIPIVAPLMINNQTLHTHQDFRFAIFPRQGGRIFELGNLQNLEWIGRYIGRIHAVGASKQFKHRCELTTKLYAEDPAKFLVSNNFIPAELKNDYSEILHEIIEIINNKFIDMGLINKIRLHGDFHPGNILWNEEFPFIVDLDDCLTGPAIQDLWMLLSPDTEENWELQVQYLLRGYQEFHDFDYRELQLIEVYRTLRMINYSGWLAKRWNDPAFPMYFPWFNTLQYWRNEVNNLSRQLEILKE